MNCPVVTPAILGGVLGVSVIINIILIIVVVVLVTKNRSTSPSLPAPPTSAMNEGGGRNQGTLDIEMKPNSLYGLTSEAIVTKPNEVYGVSLPAEPSQPVTYEYVDP
jgi:hypothetical protein